MKKNRSVIFTILIILLLIFVSGLIFAVTLDLDIPFLEADRSSQSQEVPEDVPEEVTPTDMTDEEKTARLAEIEKRLNDELLVLVNVENVLGPDDEPAEFLTVEGYRLDKTAGENLQKMLTDMRAAGHETMTIYSAFRNYAKQESNFNNKINQYINRGYDRETATEMAATIVNPPGKSEHQTGLAADICTSEMVNQYGSLPEQFAQTDAYNWLYEHCDEYGFILRYPEDKEDVTGITFEPWHYRYVGNEYAKEIMDKKICLEEYIEQLTSEKAALLVEK